MLNGFNHSRQSDLLEEVEDIDESPYVERNNFLESADLQVNVTENGSDFIVTVRWERLIPSDPVSDSWEFFEINWARTSCNENAAAYPQCDLLPQHWSMQMPKQTHKTVITFLKYTCTLNGQLTVYSTQFYHLSVF